MGGRSSGSVSRTIARTAAGWSASVCSTVSTRLRGAYSDIEVLAPDRVPFAGREDAIRTDLRAVDRSAGRPVLQRIAFRPSGGYIRLPATALDTDFTGLLPGFERVATSVEMK